jgi:hypothetical protein
VTLAWLWKLIWSFHYLEWRNSEYEV